MGVGSWEPRATPSRCVATPRAPVLPGPEVARLPFWADSATQPWQQVRGSGSPTTAATLRAPPPGCRALTEPCAPRPVRSPGYGLLMSSPDDRGSPTHTIPCRGGLNPPLQGRCGIKGGRITRYERGLVPRSYQEALCRARSWAGNGAKPRLAMPTVIQESVSLVLVELIAIYIRTVGLWC